MHVVVTARQQCVTQRGEGPRLIAARVIGKDQVERFSGLRFVVIVPMRVIPAPIVRHLFRRQAEQEEILFACLLGHLDGGSVASPQRESTVHHELHVARAAGLVTGSRDLVGDIGGGYQPLSERDAVFGKEHTLIWRRISGLPSIVPARLLMNLIMTLARW